MSTTDAWYPRAEDYWVPAEESDPYPLRYGDLCRTPDLDACRTRKGKLWQAVMVLHPSCELGAKASSDTEVLVARVNRVSGIGAPQRPAVRVGWAERDGRILVAHANTFWLAPHPTQEDDEDSYADFRRVQPVPLGQLRDAGRLAAMTHDARVHLIRREMYFKYRWMTSVDQIRDLERVRIANDPARRTTPHVGGVSLVRHGFGRPGAGADIGVACRLVARGYPVTQRLPSAHLSV